MGERLPISVIVNKWKSECGEVRTSERGVSYTVIPSSRMMESLRVLAKTLYDLGYTYDDMDEYAVSIAIADACWKEDKIRKMTNSQIKKAKLELANDWQEIIDAEYSGVKISKCEELKKVEYSPTVKTEYKKQEKALELYPSDRIKMDVSDMPDPEIDTDFLKEIGIDESFMDGKDE